MLEKPESWCSQQVAACKAEIVASQLVGGHMYDNVKNVKITYHIKKKRFLPFYGFPREISVSVYFICVNDVECSIAYFPALL